MSPWWVSARTRKLRALSNGCSRSRRLDDRHRPYPSALSRLATLKAPPPGGSPEPRFRDNAIRKCTGGDTKKCATSVAVGSRFERRREAAAVPRLLPRKPAKVPTKVSAIHSDIGQVICNVCPIPSGIRRMAQSQVASKISEILPQIEPIAPDISEIGADVRAREPAGNSALFPVSSRD
jgi:hypothetical protein